MLQLTNLLEDEQLDSATMLAAQEAIAELAGVVTGDETDADLSDQQVEATAKLQKLAPGAWEFLKPVLQSLLTTAARQQLGI